jgi:hypothetical protein
VVEGSVMKAIVAVAGALLAVVGVTKADEPEPIGYSSVAATLAALQSEPTATFENQQGWTVVASREHGEAVEWFFTPEDHPAHPSVIKRTVIERDGVGLIEVVALCQTPQSDCDRLLSDFRQTHAPSLQSTRIERVALDVGIAMNDHDRVRVQGLIAEEGKAAEIRMDGVLKAVLVPTLDQIGSVTVWTAMYEFDGNDFVLVAEPQFARPGSGTAELEMVAASGNRFEFSITPLPGPAAE